MIDVRDEEIYQQAMDAWRLGNYELALSNLSALIANSNLDLGMLHNLRANVYKESGRREEALADFENSIALSPRKRLASSTYFHFLIDNGWFTKAQEEGRRYLSTLENASEESPRSQKYLKAIRSVIGSSVPELERIFRSKQ